MIYKLVAQKTVNMRVVNWVSKVFVFRDYDKAIDIS